MVAGGFCKGGSRTAPAINENVGVNLQVHPGESPSTSLRTSEDSPLQ